MFSLSGMALGWTVWEVGGTDECAKSCQISCPCIWNPFLILYVRVLRPQLASRILKTFSSQLVVSVGESIPLFYCLIVRIKIILSIGSASPSHGRLVTFHILKPWALISLTFITSAIIVPIDMLHLSLLD